VRQSAATMQDVPAQNISDQVRSRVAVVALCVVLSILILYRSGADIDERRYRARGRRSPYRRSSHDAPQVRACEVLASPYSPFASQLALRPGARLVWVARPAALVPFEPTLDPYSRN
jgi:hypothetical protein